MCLCAKLLLSLEQRKSAERTPNRLRLVFMKRGTERSVIGTPARARVGKHGGPSRGGRMAAA